MNSVLDTAGLGRRYGSARALRDCCLRLPERKIAALVGPNGAGKTTLLLLAMGFLAPTTGEIKLFDRNPREEAAQLLPDVAFLAQDMPLYRRLKVRDIFDLGRHLNRRWDQNLAINRVRRLGIPLTHRIAHLSGGQRAQVALAVALAKRPRLLLLDEPLAPLDPLARREFVQELALANSEGVSVLLSSHLISDIERLCDYILLLNSGRLQLAGAVDEVVAQHLGRSGSRPLRTIDPDHDCPTPRPIMGQPVASGRVGTQSREFQPPRQQRIPQAEAHPASQTKLKE